MTLTWRAGLLAGLALALPIAASAEPVSLDEAVRRAIAASPAIQAQEAGIRSARAGRSQADIRPNPVLLVEAENIAGTGAYDVYRQAETTVTYAQTIERGGKRDARFRRNRIRRCEDRRVRRIKPARRREIARAHAISFGAGDFVFAEPERHQKIAAFAGGDV